MRNKARSTSLSSSELGELPTEPVDKGQLDITAGNAGKENQRPGAKRVPQEAIKTRVIDSSNR